MQDTGMREITIDERAEALPVQAVPLTPSPERLVPVADHLIPERSQCGDVAGDCEVLEVPRQHPAQPRTLLADRAVADDRQTLLHRSQTGPHPLLRGLPFDHERPVLPLQPTTVREAQEVERLRFPLAALPPIPGGEPPELDQPRLVGVQRETELLQPLFQVGQELFRLVTVLEPDDEVVRVAHDNHVSPGVPAPPLMHPQVEDVVQIHVREQW